MRQINPLYLLLLIVVILVVLVVKLWFANTEQEELKGELHVIERMGRQTQELKRTWADKTETKKRLKQILNSAPLLNSGITQKSQGSTLHLKAKSLDAGAMEYLLNKLLNGNYALASMEIKELGGDKVALQIEVSL